MLFPIQPLLAGREAPQCVSKDTKIAQALALMVQHDYSQLPIVDADGKLAGIISDQSIVEMYYHSNGAVSLLDLPVTHCQTTPTTLSEESDIFDALESLKNHSAVVILDGQQQVVGILTHYDTTHFLRDVSEGIIQVEDIELTLRRRYIEAVFPNEKDLQTAIKRALGSKKDDPNAPAQDYEALSFYQQMQLIRHPANWPHFEKFLAPQDLFWALMDQVREIRNQLMHFRGQLDPMQSRVLLRARDWLGSRPRPPAAQPQTVHVAETLPDYSSTGKYTGLETWLVKTRGKLNLIEVSFDDIEKLLNQELPASAREHRSWWANEPATNAQARAWMRAGWWVDDVDPAAGKVVFKRTDVALKQLFLDDVLVRFKKARPDLTRVQKALPQNWLNFGAGKSGFAFSWSVASGVAWVELYIDTGDRDANKRYFDALHAQKQEVEKIVGVELDWQRLDKRQGCRILLKRPDVKIDTYPPEALDPAKQWAVDMMLKFVDALQPRVKEL
ncbi:MAG: DUF4268 domain-containing protein [Anaerolineae bacterium]|nr:DUF4268 domain-containing protein [Anaerolineae bacterium]